MSMERCWKDGDKEKRKFWEKSQVVYRKSQWNDQESNSILRGKRQATNYLLKEKSWIDFFNYLIPTPQ